jgi:hypothetical protein
MAVVMVAARLLEVVAVKALLALQEVLALALHHQLLELL